MKINQSVTHNMNSLPTAVLGKILSHLEEQEARVTRQVCRSWDEWFRNNVGLRLKTNNKNYQILSYKCKRFGAFQKLTFSDVTLPLQDLIPTADNPIHLTCLEFHRISISYNILWALRTFKNLQDLNFSRVLMEKGPPLHNPVTNRICLNKLKSIKFYSKTGDYDEDDSIMTELSHLPEDENCILDFLSSIETGVLSTLTMFMSSEILVSQPLQQLFEEGPNFADMTAITKLLYRNRFQMQNFFAGTVPGHFLVGMIFKPDKAKLGMKLEVYDSIIDTPMQWNFIFAIQSQFLYLRVYNAFIHWASIQNGVSKSKEVVSEVHLTGGGDGSLADLAGFSQCNKLRWLEIHLDDCHLLNFGMLPLNIKLLSLDGPLSTQDLTTIAFRLANLEVFEVKSNLQSTNHLYYGTNTVITATIIPTLLKLFLSLENIECLTFASSKVDKNSVEDFLGGIHWLTYTLKPVPEYPPNTIGTLQIIVLPDLVDYS